MFGIGQDFRNIEKYSCISIGYPDVVHVNIAGQPQAFINQGGNANYLKIKLPDTVKSIGAKIMVKRSDGKTLYRDYVSGEGLCSDQSHVQIFGLESGHATDVTVKYLSGETEVRQGTFSQQTLAFD